MPTLFTRVNLNRVPAGLIERKPALLIKVEPNQSTTTIRDADIWERSLCGEVYCAVTKVAALACGKPGTTGIWIPKPIINGCKNLNFKGLSY